jgi:hypothetical protein
LSALAGAPLPALAVGSAVGLAAAPGVRVTSTSRIGYASFTYRKKNASDSASTIKPTICEVTSKPAGESFSVVAAGSARGAGAAAASDAGGRQGESAARPGRLARPSVATRAVCGD